jgi:hypothetical protein
MDPMKHDILRITENTGPIDMDVVISNFLVNGLSKGTIYKFKGFDKNVLEIGVKTPLLTIRGPYKMNGKVVFIPVSGDGTTDMKYCKFKSIKSNVDY